MNVEMPNYRAIGKPHGGKCVFFVEDPDIDAAMHRLLQAGISKLWRENGLGPSLRIATDRQKECGKQPTTPYHSNLSDRGKTQYLVQSQGIAFIALSS